MSICKPKNTSLVLICRYVDQYCGILGNIMLDLCHSARLLLAGAATSIVFVETKLLSRQTRDKTCSVVTNTCLSRQIRVSRDKAFVATKMILVAKSLQSACLRHKFKVHGSGWTPLCHWQDTGTESELDNGSPAGALRTTTGLKVNAGINRFLCCCYHTLIWW